jgi:uncharacterized protein involved in oxidation of intracellular sulfur
MKVLFLLNDPPYGTERSYNAVRLANALLRREGIEVKMFLFADAVFAALDGQKVPQGYYNLGQMVSAAGRKGGEIGCCGSCMDARGITDAMLVEGARRSSLDESADWTVWADKVICF